jgi:small subunit ribosomal protein S2
LTTAGWKVDEPGAVYSQPKADPLEQLDPVVENWQLRQLQRRLDHRLGADVRPHYQPRSLINNPPSPDEVTLELLLASQSHLGHVTSVWNPANARYIFGIRQGIHIISLDATASHLRRAARVVQAVAEKAGLILFVGTGEGQDRAVVKAAELSGGYHLFERWIPGSITNGQQILGHCALKVVDHLDNEVVGFDRQLAVRAVLKPDLVVCLNPCDNKTLLKECAMHNVPTIGVIDTDADPTWVTYPIPANDDSIRCGQVIAGALGRAGAEGQRRRRHAALTGTVPYLQDLTLVEPTGALDKYSGSTAEMEKELFASAEENTEVALQRA